MDDRGVALLAFVSRRFVPVEFFERRAERWKSEAQLGEALSVLFGKDGIQRHARPLWLSLQHLDFFIPRERLAVEYMGLQHYASVDVFGGAEALEATTERDERKRELCQKMDVTLVYVTHEEDIGKRAREIFQQYGNR